MSDQRTAQWAEAAVREHEAQAQRDQAGAQHEDHELAQYPSGRPHPSREQQVLERIDKARRCKPSRFC